MTIFYLFYNYRLTFTIEVFCFYRVKKKNTLVYMFKNWDHIELRMYYGFALFALSSRYNFDDPCVGQVLPSFPFSGSTTAF